jgi:2-methylcitrate dehydratase PrpD
LRARVAVEEDESVPVEAALVTLRLTDGTSLAEHVRHGRGTPGRPMSDDELDAKVRELIASGAPRVDAAGLIAAIRAILGEADAARIVRLTVAA